LKLFVRAQPLQKKLHAREEERISKRYEEILRYLDLDDEEISTTCFRVEEVIEGVPEFLRGYLLCIKRGRAKFRYFITLYLKRDEEIHDRLTLFFDEKGEHVETEYIHSLGRVHRMEDETRIREYECAIEGLFSHVLGERVELIIELP